MLNDINGTLLRHLATGAGAASLLRGKRPKIVDLTRRFFETRTDIRRLSSAQEVAQEILLINDLTEFVQIRDIVAKQELRRQIQYVKQQDHTAHTVYLFFLGLWFYDSMPQMATAVSIKCPHLNARQRDEYFLLQWTYASILHDVGYAFHTLNSETQEDRELIDGIYTWEWVKREGGELSETAEDALKKAFEEWNTTYGQRMPLGTATYDADRCADLLERLSHAPWLSDLDGSFKEKDLFAVLDYDRTSLRDYAIEVAHDGYGGGGRGVDHAVASGLLLFQYTTYWYWLMDHVRRHHSREVYDEVSHGYDYAVANIVSDFLPACRAVAFHNIQANTKVGTTIIPTLTLQNEPVTFLAILCDELQRWDRYPAGATYLDTFRFYSALESGDIYLMCNGTRDNPTAAFVVRTRAGVETDMKLAKDIAATIATRLPGYSRQLPLNVLALEYTSEEVVANFQFKFLGWS